MVKSRGYFSFVSMFLICIGSGIIALSAYYFMNNGSFLGTLDEVINLVMSQMSLGYSITLNPWWIFAVVGTIILVPIGFYLMNKKTVPPALEAYTEDRFKNWYWRWEWTWNAVFNQWEVENLTPFCPDCDVELLDKSSASTSIAGCPQCHKKFEEQFREYDEPKSIEYIIHKRLREKKN